MELIVEAVLRDGLFGEDAMGKFLDQVDLTGSWAELFFAEWSPENQTLTAVFQTRANNKSQAVRRTSHEVDRALRAIQREDLIESVAYCVRLPDVEDARMEEVVAS